MKMSQGAWMVLALLGVSTQAHAMKAMVLEGGRVGNGGGLVVCRDAKGIKSVEVLDFYEAKKLRDWSLEPIAGSSWQEKTGEMIRRLGEKSPFREELYGRWLKSFESEMRILDTVEFSKVGDSAHVAVPEGCEFEQGAIQVPPRFSGDKRYYINAALWNVMDDTQKAGLVFHELIYREAIGYGHSDSISVRYLNGLINSAQLDVTSDEQWVRTMRQARFELTDVAFPTAGFVAKIDLSTMTGPSSANDLPEIFELKGRAPILLGVCHGTGCSDFEPHTPRDYSRHSPYLSLHPSVIAFSVPEFTVQRWGGRPDAFIEVTPWVSEIRTNRIGNPLQFLEYQFLRVTGRVSGKQIDGVMDALRLRQIGIGEGWAFESFEAVQYEVIEESGYKSFELYTPTNCHAAKVTYAYQSTELKSVALIPREGQRCTGPAEIRVRRGNFKAVLDESRPLIEF